YNYAGDTSFLIENYPSISDTLIFIEIFDENCDMKIHQQDEFCRICASDDYLREILSPNFT
ncbi:unnamed protein product, partial [Rotaria sp. Silwood2]